MSQDIRTVDTTSDWVTANLGRGKMTFNTECEVDQAFGLIKYHLS